LTTVDFWRADAAPDFLGSPLIGGLAVSHPGGSVRVAQRRGEPIVGYRIMDNRRGVCRHFAFALSPNH
jgi:hypothetical protein